MGEALESFASTLRVYALKVTAAVEVDEGRRAAQFKQIQQIVGRELPVLPIVTVPSIVVHSARLHDFHNSIDLMSGDLSDAWIDPRK